MGWSIRPAKAARLPGRPDIGECGMPPRVLQLELTRRKILLGEAPAWCTLAMPGVQLPLGVKLRDLHGSGMAAVRPITSPCRY